MENQAKANQAEADFVAVAPFVQPLVMDVGPPLLFVPLKYHQPYVVPDLPKAIKTINEYRKKVISQIYFHITYEFLIYIDMVRKGKKLITEAEYFDAIKYIYIQREKVRYERFKNLINFNKLTEYLFNNQIYEIGGKLYDAINYYSRVGNYPPQFEILIHPHTRQYNINQYVPKKDELIKQIFKKLYGRQYEIYYNIYLNYEEGYIKPQFNFNIFTSDDNLFEENQEITLMKGEGLQKYFKLRGEKNKLFFDIITEEKRRQDENAPDEAELPNIINGSCVVCLGQNEEVITNFKTCGCDAYICSECYLEAPTNIIRKCNGYCQEYTFNENFHITKPLRYYFDLFKDVYFFEDEPNICNEAEDDDDYFFVWRDKWGVKKALVKIFEDVDIMTEYIDHRLDSLAEYGFDYTFLEQYLNLDEVPLFLEPYMRDLLRIYSEGTQDINDPDDKRQRETDAIEFLHRFVDLKDCFRYNDQDEIKEFAKERYATGYNVEDNIYINVDTNTLIYSPEEDGDICNLFGVSFEEIAVNILGK